MLAGFRLSRIERHRRIHECRSNLLTLPVVSVPAVERRLIRRSGLSSILDIVLFFSFNDDATNFDKTSIGSSPIRLILNLADISSLYPRDSSGNHSDLIM